MYRPALPYLEIGASREEAEMSVILMHGLGADGHDFSDLAQMLCQSAVPRKWRFVLPHAPKLAVTINMGMVMPAWYDILQLNHPRAVNWDTVQESQKNIETLMGVETAEKIVLAGFSQGAAMALHVGLRHQSETAGILMMSGYLLESEDYPCPAKSGDVPIGIFHGSHDPVVPLIAAQESVATLKETGYSPIFKTYAGLEHSVSEEEIRDVYDWLSGVG